MGLRGEPVVDQPLQLTGERVVAGVPGAQDDERLQHLSTQGVGTPMTAVSTTRGWVTRTLSTSNGPIR